MNLVDNSILKLALPSIISNITVPLLGLVDLAIVGHIGSETYIGSIAVGSMIFNVIYWIFGFLRMGNSGMTSQALGRKDYKAVLQVLKRSMIVAFSISFLFLISQLPLCKLSLWIMHPSDAVSDLTRIYFFICIWGAPAMLILYALNGWFYRSTKHSHSYDDSSISECSKHHLESFLCYCFRDENRRSGFRYRNSTMEWCTHWIMVCLWKHGETTQEVNVFAYSY